MAFAWRYEKLDGTVIDSPGEIGAHDPHPTQADAEAWIGTAWRDLLENGVDAVTLLEDDHEVYGPMSLHPAP